MEVMREERELDTATSTPKFVSARIASLARDIESVKFERMIIETRIEQKRQLATI